MPFDEFLRDKWEEMEERGYQIGYKKGYKIGIDRGLKIIIRDDIENGKSKDEIIKMMEKYFEFTEEEAESYYERFAEEENMEQ